MDNEPQIQSLNINRHLEVAHNLLKIKKAYKCICTEDQLTVRRKKINTGDINSKKICISCETDDEVQSLGKGYVCLLYTSPSPRDRQKSRMPSSA